MENKRVGEYLHAVHPSWHELLKTEFQKAYFQELMHFVEQEYDQFPNAIFPTYDRIFRAFQLCRLDELKVVILGQDPYPTYGYADGLCFSHAPDKSPMAKSLVNIFSELNTDLGTSKTLSSDLSSWAKQGVLLLNSMLTVREQQPQSHRNCGWEQFTDAVIDNISQTQQNIVFLLWGEYAQKKGKNIDAKKHLILKSGHPSPLSANRGRWFGNRHFSQTNHYLQQNNKQIINFVDR